MGDMVEQTTNCFGVLFIAADPSGLRIMGWVPESCSGRFGTKLLEYSQSDLLRFDISLDTTSSGTAGLSLAAPCTLFGIRALLATSQRTNSS